VKKVVLLALVLLISIAFVSSSFAFSKAPPEKASPEGAPATEKAPAAEKVPAPKQRAAKPKVSGFVGTVTMVDASLLQVKGKKAEVAFDANNPELKGYNAIGDVMVGDTVAVKYTKDGVTITKLKGTAKTKAAEEKKVEIAKKAPKEETVRLFTCKGKGPCTVSVNKVTE